MQEVLKKRLSDLQALLKCKEEWLDNSPDELNQAFIDGYNKALRKEIAFLKIVLGEITSVQS